MKELEKELEALKLEFEEMQSQWANEIKKLSSARGFDVNSKSADKKMEKIAAKYAKDMAANLDAQREIVRQLNEMKEEERKKLYKD